MRNTRDIFSASSISDEQAELMLANMIETIRNHYINSPYPPAKENGTEFLAMIEKMQKEDKSARNILITVKMKIDLKEFHYRDDKDSINRIDPEFIANMKMILTTPIAAPKVEKKPVVETKRESIKPAAIDRPDENREWVKKSMQRKKFESSQWQDPALCKYMKDIVLAYSDKDSNEGGMYYNILKGDDADLPQRLSMVFSFAKFRADSKFDREKAEFHETLLMLFDRALEEHLNKAPALPATPSPTTAPLPKSASPDAKPAGFTGTMFRSNTGAVYQKLKEACNKLAKQDWIDTAAYQQVIKDIKDSSLPKQNQSTLLNILQDGLRGAKPTPDTKALLESIDHLKSERKSGFENK